MKWLTKLQSRRELCRAIFDASWNLKILVNNRASDPGRVPPKRYRNFVVESEHRVDGNSLKGKIRGEVGVKWVTRLAGFSWRSFCCGVRKFKGYTFLKFLACSSVKILFSYIPILIILNPP